MFVQAPDRGVLPGHRHVPDDGHPHVRVGLQAEGEDGGADEEHGDHSNHLKEKFSSLEGEIKFSSMMYIIRCLS